MRKYFWLILLLFPIRLISQVSDDKFIIEKWKEVEALLAMKNYEQTLPYIAVIKAHAKKENNSAEWIRAILAENQVKTINKNGEQAFISIRAHFDNSISESNAIEKAILNNYYAMFLWANANNYKTKSSDNYLTAAGTQKLKIIDSVFKESIKDEQILINTKTEQFSTLFDAVQNLTLTPTVYHFLSYQYLDFLKHVNKSVDHDKIYQNILALNIKNKWLDATSYLLTKDISMNRYSPKEWVPKIENIIATHRSDYNAYLLYMIANSYFDRDKATSNKYIEQAKTNYSTSPWIGNIISLEKRLKQAEIKVEHALFEPSQSYIPIKLTTRNTNKLFIRVFKTTNTPKEYKDWNVKHDSITFLTSIDAELIYEESKGLKTFDDFENHSTIYKINPLPYGNYTIIVSNNAAFKNDGEEQTTSISNLIVSDIFISSTLDKETNKDDFYKFLLINRKTGAPYFNKSVQIYKTQFNELELITKLETDAKGEFYFKTNSSNLRTDLKYYDIYIPEENQFIDLKDLNDVPKHLEKEDETNGDNRFQTMSDRAIYRPGQEIYFKSILYNNHKIKGHVISNEEVTIHLLDANRQKIDSLKLITNEFGSINGKFKLPSQTLAGSFRLELKTKSNESGSHYFRVEEYKRPSFKVEFEANKETYTHRDTAIFVGKVESLAGAKLSDASVRYKVNFYNSKNYKTVNYVDSLIQTDDEGKFYIKIPLSDTTFSQLNNFRLDYSAEVTNQSGEMQQASDGYNFTTKPWRISIYTKPNIEEGKWSEIHIITKNQHGYPLKFAGKINIYKKDLITKPITNKYLSYFREGDYHLLDTNDYETYFPNYFDKQILKGDTKHLIASYDFDTRDTSLVQIDSNLFTRGVYQIEALTIQEQDTIIASAYTNVFDPIKRKIAENSFFSWRRNKESYSIGDNVIITFNSDVKNPSSVFLFESLGNKKLPTKVLNLKKGEVTYSFKFTEKMSSPNIVLNALFLNNNQAQNFTIHIPVVEKSKNIDITTHTFRDKITPGQKEKWKFTLKAKDNNLSAELLATMYDSSLDAFASNSLPSQFYLYQDYSNIDFYYLLNEFNQNNNSYSLFNKPIKFQELGNGLSIPRTYDLWIPQDHYYLRRNFGDDAGTLEEVVVVGYGRQEKRTLTGSSVAISGKDISGSAYGSTRGVEGGTGKGEEIFQSVSLYDELKDPNLRAEVEALKNKQKEELLNNVQARTNLQETAFFYPTLYTDAEGNVSFEFDSPEALTKWKLLLFAHSKTLQAGSATFFTQTQKQLMVRPNLPRYVREGDKITLKAQIQNLSKEIQKGNARIEIINPETNENITAKFIAQNSTTSFEAEASKNSIVEWELLVPKDYPTVHIKIVAATDEFSDGEMQELPILPNRILISDTEKIIIKPNQTQDYKIEAANKDNLQARIQVQSNPILEIISALDYLKNYPYECNEQLVSKWFGLKIVEYIAKHYPAISNYFKTVNTEEASSKLEENATLNQFKIEEMPWLRDIQQDEAKLKAIAKLFNSGIQQELKFLEQKISKNQMSTGGFAWFDGGKENLYISTRILEILGKTLYLDPTLINPNMKTVAQKISSYLDKDSTMFSPTQSYYNTLDYLYTRQYWNGLYPMDKNKVEKLQATIAKSSLTTANLPAGIAAKSWVSSQLFGTGKTSTEIKNRITQEAISDTEKGMYWESNNSFYNSTSFQSYMVEAYKLHDQSKLYDITQWLFYSKQANHWQTTWMTVDAIYALLLANNPKDFMVENTVRVWVNEQETQQNKLILGQFTKSLLKQELNTDKQIKVQNNNNRTVFGNIVHQYFSPLQSIQKTVKDISVRKQYFVERNGKWIETDEAKLGERIKVKITVINDNPLQYVHIKDARPSGVEPIYQPSGYKWWQGYYFTSKDASTNYFYDNMKKGLTELEYEVKANNVGVFNSGITTLECMYDPSVMARSENKILTIVP